jgi:RHS repeat-associated protein
VTYTHDLRSRLVGYTQGGTTASYLHDPFGRRIKKTVNAQVTWYLWDGNQLLAEYNATGTRTARYAYLPGEVSPLQYQDANGTYWVHGDHLTAPVALTTSTGQVVWRAKYQTYGNALVNAGADGNGTPVTFNLRFPGQYFDQESTLHYNRFRDYDPSTGRYLQSDPIGQAGGINTYRYAAGNPIVAVDVQGLCPESSAETQRRRNLCAMISLGDGGTAARGACYFYNDPSISDGTKTSVVFIGAMLMTGGSIGILAPEAAPLLAFGLEVPNLMDGIPPGPGVIGGAAGGGSRLGDLTAREVRQIQSVVNQAGRPLEVPGSAARGTRRGVGTDLPIGKGYGTRSDIDYLVPPSSGSYFRGLESGLPSLDPRSGIIPGVGNPFIGPVIRFEPGTSPIFIPGVTP